MKIDKSKFSAEELAQYEALIAKAIVPEDEPDGAGGKPDAGKGELIGKGETSIGGTMESVGKSEAPAAGETEPSKQEDVGKAQEAAEGTEPAQKSAPAPELVAAMDRLEKLEKKIELGQLTEVAKKYAILGEKEDKLAETFYRLEKSDPESYKAYVALLDKQLELINKSGLFTEIGKSGSGAGTGGSVVDRIEAAAGEIQKADPSMSHAAAVAKAWNDNPALAAEYDEEYAKGV